MNVCDSNTRRRRNRLRTSPPLQLNDKLKPANEAKISAADYARKVVPIPDEFDRLTELAAALGI